MKNKFNWCDDLIDSRQIIERHEELFDEHYDLEETLKLAHQDYVEYQDKCASAVEFNQEAFDEDVEELQKAIDDAQEALDQFNQSFDKDELDLLTEVIAEGEDAPDWNHGTTLIHENYFTQYTQDLIEDTCEVPAEFSSGKWPWNHASIDFDSAAEELKSDYTSIDADGHTYYLRS